MRGDLHFGLNLTGFGLVNFFHRQFDNILIGWKYGPAELGQYNRAYQLMMLPITVFNNSLSSAIQPSLSRLQHEPERWRRAYLDALTLISFLGGLISACLIAAHASLIAVVYGPQWTDAADVLWWLAISCLSGVPMNATGWIYISLGRTSRMFAWSLRFNPVLCSAFVLALPYGATGIACAYALVINLALVPCFAYATKGSPVSLGEVLKVVLPMSLCGGVAAWGASTLPVQDLAPLARLVAQTGMATLCFGVLGATCLFTMGAYRDARLRALWMIRQSPSTAPSAVRADLHSGCLPPRAFAGVPPDVSARGASHPEGRAAGDRGAAWRG